MTKLYKVKVQQPHSPRANPNNWTRWCVVAADSAEQAVTRTQAVCLNPNETVVGAVELPVNGWAGNVQVLQ